MKKKRTSIKHLTWRALLLAIPGAILITASSSYVALRASALPWPTIFVTVLAMIVMRMFRRRDVNEIHVASTGMTAGAMVAGGLVFTLPGLFITGMWKIDRSSGQTAGDFIRQHLPTVLLIALAGVLIGTTLCWFFRKRNIEEMELPYPIGKAAAATISAGETGGIKAIVLFSFLAVAAVITLLRDEFHLIPSMFAFSIAGIPLTLQVSPMALGIGTLIGCKSTIYWLVGAAITTLGRFILLRMAAGGGWSGVETAFAGWNLTTAIALMVGAGAGTLITFIFGSLRRDKNVASHKGRKKRDTTKASPGTSNRGVSFFSLILVAVAFVLSIVIGLKVLPAILLMGGVFFAAMMSSIITGQTGVNPMEVFGIIVLLAIRIAVNVSSTHAFFIAAIVAVACGYAGDMMNDYKAGSILKTNPTAQYLIELICGVFGAVTASVAILAIIYSAGGIGADTGLPAAQAHSVAAMVQGIGDPAFFIIGAVAGCLLTMLKVPAMIIGIGMMLAGYGLAIPIFIGGLIELITRKTTTENSQHSIQMGAAGTLGGEGLTGTILAIIGLFR
ncbi:MAG TPA: peptide transporter [Clostridiaceae bacterium]|nr:peptide transporter [Clostridiaceae bacterium]